MTESKRYQGTDVTDLSLPVDPETRLYHYDPIGNRENVTTGTETTTYTANQLNQYDEITTGGDTASLTYDADGNLTAWDGKVLAYNAENRLIAITPDTPAEGDKKLEFVYDFMGRRVQKTVSAYSAGAWAVEKEIFFVYDGWNVVQEKTIAGTATDKYYVWGLDLSQSLQGAGGIGGLIAAVDGSLTYQYLYDANGNVGQMVNAADGMIVAHYEYDPFGNEIVASGANANDNPYRFSTKYFDFETNLHYFGYRYYCSQLGRWLTRDPISELGGLNFYSFVENRTINRIDKLGLYWNYLNDPDAWEEALFEGQGPLTEPLEPTIEDGREFVERFRLFLSPLEGLLEDGVGEIKEIYTGFKDRAKSKASFAHDIRIPGINAGIFRTKFGGVLKVTSDGCCVKVTGGPTFAAVAKGPSAITLAGGISVTGGVNYKCCWNGNIEKWSGSIGGTGFIELRVGLDVWVAAAYAAGGVYVNYKYDFSTDKGKFGLGGHIRAVFESDLGVWTKRRQYKYTIGDPDVHF